MPIRVYNTLTQQKEPLQTVVPGKVGMYVCGPTVYSKSHIGHMVGPVVFDTIKRYLVYSGYDVTWVVNITDVDDKLIVRVQEQGATEGDMAARVKALAELVTADYLDCLKALGVVGIDHLPRATEHIGDIIQITEGLIDKGFAYPSQGDVYFDVTKDSDYGKLSHRNPEELEAGSRVEPTALKRHPGDFALWKSSKPGEPAWPSPWGPGRPGWHIECSAMSMKLLGEHFDIHGGGLDLVFPHHENEVAQSESYSGKTFATYWLHNGLLTKEGKKISKSDPETVVLMNDLLEKHDPDTIRALLLASHYRRPTDYSNNRLDEVRRGLVAFYNLFERFERLTNSSFYDLSSPSRREPFDRKIYVDQALAEQLDGHRARFLDAMDDDFNTGGALGEFYGVVRTLNRFGDAANLEVSRDASQIRDFASGIQVIREMSQLLGLFRAPTASPKVENEGLSSGLLDMLIQLRATLRKEKHFKLADEIRTKLTALGVTLEDRAEGTIWRIDTP
jgi:cysteinyl-tRNA synthetase